MHFEENRNLSDNFDIQTKLVIYNFLSLIPTDDLNSTQQSEVKDDRLLVSSKKDLHKVFDEIKKPKKLKSSNRYQPDYKQIKKSIISELKYRNKANYNSGDPNDLNISMTFIKKNKKLKVLIPQNSYDGCDLKLERSSDDNRHEYARPSIHSKRDNSMEIYLIPNINEPSQPQYSTCSSINDPPIDSDYQQSLTEDIKFSNYENSVKKFSYQSDGFGIYKNSDMVHQNIYVDIKSLDELDMIDMNIHSKNHIQLKKEINDAIRRLQPQLEANKLLKSQRIAHQILPLSITRKIDDHHAPNDKRDNMNLSLNTVKSISSCKQMKYVEYDSADCPIETGSFHCNTTDYSYRKILNENTFRGKLSSKVNSGSFQANHESDVAETLRLIGDDLEREYSNFLNKTCTQVNMNANNVKQALRMAISRIITLTRGWNMVSMILILCQRFMTMLMRKGGDPQIDLLVQEVAAIIRENCYDFINQNGGWMALSGLSLFINSATNYDYQGSEVD